MVASKAESGVEAAVVLVPPLLLPPPPPPLLPARGLMTRALIGSSTKGAPGAFILRGASASSGAEGLEAPCPLLSCCPLAMCKKQIAAEERQQPLLACRVLRRQCSGDQTPQLPRAASRPRLIET